MKKNKCIFCGSEAKEYKGIDGLDIVMHIDCPACGTYLYQKDLYYDVINRYKNDFACYLYYNKNRLVPENKTPFCFIGEDKYFERIKKQFPWSYHITADEIKTYMPISFSDTVTRILLNYAKKARYFGGKFVMTSEEIYSSLFIRRYDEKGNDLENKIIIDQEQQMIKYLMKNRFVEYVDIGNKSEINILPEGWERIDGLQLDDSNNKNAFVSMAFNEDTKNTRECINEAIINAGYTPIIIDELIHNKQIIPEMLRLIRESRFLILDITDPNYGAYYEAGYALGLGKEVIVGCSEEIFNREYVTAGEKKMKKYLKPHFDIAQKQILVWKDLDEYKERLEEWIKAIIG